MFRGCFCAQYISIRHPNRRPSKQKHRMNATAKENKQRFAYLFRSKPNSKLTRRPPLICNTNEAKRSIHLAREVSLSICIVSEAQQKRLKSHVPICYDMSCARSILANLCIVIASREPHMNDTIEIRYTDLLYDCSEIETNTTTIMRRDTTSHITANDWLLNSTTTYSRVWECIVESIARLFLFYFLAQRRRTDSCEILVGVLVSSRKHICSVSRARSPQLTKHK